MDIQAIAKEHGVSANEVRSRFLVLRVALWKSDFRRFAREIIRIRTKETGLDPLILNPAQLALHKAAEKQLRDEKWVRIIGLKGRQQGFSTYVAARGYWRATLWDRQHIYILSHEMDSTNKLFKMVELMQANNDFPPQVGTDNAKELEFKARGSSYSVATAGQKASGRGGNTSFFHGSEVSRWTNAPDHFAASVETVPNVKGEWGVLWTKPAKPLPFEEKFPDQIEGWVKAPSEIWLETTSAGPTGQFYEMYMKAVNKTGAYRNVFVPWTLTTEYSAEGDFDARTEPDDDGMMSESEYQETYGLTDGQMLWRRGKIESLGPALFQQEYPIDFMEAFSAADTDSFIKSASILRAMKRKMATPDAPLIVGVDPAGAGGDRFAVAWRRGDKCLKIEHRSRLEHDESVAWIVQVIQDDKPARVCIDSGSMGRNIISSIRALDPNFALIVRSVDFGGKSQAKLAMPNKSGPWNRRAEIYGRLREWLADADIPDRDDLMADLSGPKTKWRANNDWLLESKIEMKARGVKSPDLADALALTFAVQEYIPEWANEKIKTGFTSGQLDSPVYSSTSSYSGRNGWMA